MLKSIKIVIKNKNEVIGPNHNIIRLPNSEKQKTKYHEKSNSIEIICNWVRILFYLR